MHTIEYRLHTQGDNRTGKLQSKLSESLCSLLVVKQQTLTNITNAVTLSSKIPENSACKHTTRNTMYNRN